jgi:hypothetical protein
MLISHSEAVSHDVAKEAAEHEEHLTMFCISCKISYAFMFYVCLFSYSSMGFWLSMLFNRWHKRAGLQFCLE